MDAIIHFAAIILLLGLGLLFTKGKCAFLIAGYNTAPRAEKAKYDERALCRFMGRLMFALAGCWCLVALGAGLDVGWLHGAGIAAFLAAVFGAVIYANTGSHFRTKK